MGPKLCHTSGAREQNVELYPIVTILLSFTSGKSTSRTVAGRVQLLYTAGIILLYCNWMHNTILWVTVRKANRRYKYQNNQFSNKTLFIFHLIVIAVMGSAEQGRMFWSTWSWTEWPRVVKRSTSQPLWNTSGTRGVGWSRPDLSSNSLSWLWRRKYMRFWRRSCLDCHPSISQFNHHVKSSDIGLHT